MPGQIVSSWLTVTTVGGVTVEPVSTNGVQRVPTAAMLARTSIVLAPIRPSVPLVVTTIPLFRKSLFCGPTQAPLVGMEKLPVKVPVFNIAASVPTLCTVPEPARNVVGFRLMLTMDCAGGIEAE